MTSITQNLASLRLRAKGATLIAVTKTQPIEAIHEALAAGQRVFGENRVQEAQSKFPALRKLYGDIELHLIGALQTNKARDAVELFDVIETLDRPALAKALAKAIKKTGRTPRLYIEINIGKEPQKAGISPEKIKDFLHFCQNDCGLSISGLMCIPPQGQDPRFYFEQMRSLANHLKLGHVSMGMSEDYEIALQCGATEIRLGTAIFGRRPSL